MPITANDIRPYIDQAVDIDETKKLIEDFAGLRCTRRPMFLTKVEFNSVLKWKLRSQYGRQEAIRERNTDKIISIVTGAAFTVEHDNPEYELEFKINTLCVLRGVGVPVASAILTLVFPEKYGVIDFRNWRQLFDEEKSDFNLGDYKNYMRRIRMLSRELDCTVQQVDSAIWEYDRQKIC